MTILKFDAETQCGITHYHQTYLHPTIGEIIERIINEKEDIRKIIITPAPVRPIKRIEMEDETIITEQNIRINISKNKIQLGML